MIRAQFTALDDANGEAGTIAVTEIAVVPRIGEAIKFEGVKQLFEVVDVEWLVARGVMTVRILCGHYLAGHHKR